MSLPAWFPALQRTCLRAPLRNNRGVTALPILRKRKIRGGPRARQSGGHFRVQSGTDLFTAFQTELGLGRTNLSALRAEHVRGRVPMVDDEIANVWNPREGVGKDEDGIALVEKGIT